MHSFAIGMSGSIRSIVAGFRSTVSLAFPMKNGARHSDVSHERYVRQFLRRIPEVRCDGCVQRLAGRFLLDRMASRPTKPVRPVVSAAQRRRFCRRKERGQGALACGLVEKP